MKKAVWFSLVLAAACGGGGGGGSPEAKCNSLLNSYCARAVSCASKEDVLGDYTKAELTDECKSAAGDYLGCESVTDTTDDYSSCVRQAKSFDCDDSNQSLVEDMTFLVPATCESAFE